MWADHKGHRVLLHKTNALGTEYSFPSLDQDYAVHVNVPSDLFMSSMESTALLTANAGNKLPRLCTVVRVRAPQAIE